VGEAGTQPVAANSKAASHGAFTQKIPPRFMFASFSYLSPLSVASEITRLKAYAQAKESPGFLRLRIRL
jgi:hypothetical protein